MTEGVAERVDCDGVGPNHLECHPDVQCDQWLILDDEDGMRCQRLPSRNKRDD
jgi:hypothetical protein